VVQNDKAVTEQPISHVTSNSEEAVNDALPTSRINSSADDDSVFLIDPEAVNLQATYTASHSASDNYPPPLSRASMAECEVRETLKRIEARISAQDERFAEIVREAVRKELGELRKAFLPLIGDY